MFVQISRLTFWTRYGSECSLDKKEAISSDEAITSVELQPMNRYLAVIKLFWFNCCFYFDNSVVYISWVISLVVYKTEFSCRIVTKAHININKSYSLKKLFTITEISYVNQIFVMLFLNLAY